MIDKTAIADYASSNGAREVHRAWRDTMGKQGRYVDPKRAEFSSLSLEDVELDIQIAFDVVMDFLVWSESHD